MSKPEKYGGLPQFIQPRASYELNDQKVWGLRPSVARAFGAGAINAVVLSLLPVLLIVGTLNYLANGWNHFARELLVHWPVTVVPLAVLALIGGVAGVMRR